MRSIADIDGLLHNYGAYSDPHPFANYFLQWYGRIVWIAGVCMGQNNGFGRNQCTVADRQAPSDIKASAPIDDYFLSKPKGTTWQLGNYPNMVAEADSALDEDSSRALQVEVFANSHPNFK
jgi:hypothetical protein